jgi:predicted HicB family RNase H-like nuclease
MDPRERLFDLHPFEFRLAREDKERLRRTSAEAGLSMSEYVRRAITSYADEMELREAIETIGKQISNLQVRG